MVRDAGRQPALTAAILVAAYLPLQPVLAAAARAAGLQGWSDLDGLARWTSTAVVLLLGAALAGTLAVDYARRPHPAPLRRWATGAVSGLAVLLFLSCLLTLTQALLTWAGSQAAAMALAVDSLLLAALGAAAFHAVAERPGAENSAVAVPETASR